MSYGLPAPEVILEKASSISKFHMDPNFLADVVRDSFDVYEVPLKGWDVKEWRCEALAFGRNVPCLPSGLKSGSPRTVSKVNLPSSEGLIVFKGKVLPKVDEVVEGPSLTLPEDFESLFVNAMVEGDYRAKVIVESVQGARAYVREGDDVCVATYYQSFWYGTAHNATALALLSLIKSNRTLIFLPYLADDYEEAFENCSVIYLLEGLGVCDGLSKEGGILKIGCKGETFGSPFDTPDKVDLDLLKRQSELVWAILT